MKLKEDWSADDAKRLQQMRADAGWSLPDLARRACLSVAQVTQLEQGGYPHFYTCPLFTSYAADQSKSSNVVGV